MPGFRGLGVYNMLTAWQLDQVLDEAERNNIHVMLTIDQARDLDKGMEWEEFSL